MPIFDRDLIWLLRGRQRRAVFTKLKPQFMPNHLRKELNKELAKPLSLREMSRHIRNFEQKKLVKCLNSKDPYNKIYVVSEYGRKMQKKLQLINSV